MPDAAETLSSSSQTPHFQLANLKERAATALLVGVFKQHWRIISLAGCLWVLASLFESSTIGILVLALKALSGEAIEGIVAKIPVLGAMLARPLGLLEAKSFFLVLICGAVAAQLVVSVLNFSSRATAARLQADVEGDLRSRIFRRLMGMGYARVMRYKVGELASYNDQINYVGHVIQLLNLIASQLTMAAAYVVLLLWLSWKMSLAALIAVAILSVSLRQIIRRIRFLGAKFTKTSVSLAARTVEFLRGIRLIRTFGREDFAIDQVESVIFENVRYRRRGLTWHATISPLSDALTILGLAGLLVGGYLMLDQSSNDILPELVAFVFVLYRLMPRVKFVNERLAYINSYWDFVRRVGTMLLTQDTEIRSSGNRTFTGLTRGIEFRNLGLRYADDKDWAVRDLSCWIPKNSIVGLVGESGSGKSTVADLLLALYLPSEGQIRIDGVDLREIDWDSWRAHMGIVTSEAFIFHETIWSNIAFGRLDASEEEIIAAAREADAHAFITQLPDGYDSIVGDQGYGISAGQRQRIALARALVRDPEILILDEATSSLDSASERRIMETLTRERGKRTILIIAHRLSTLKDADRILVLDQGRLVEDGSHKALLGRGSLYARLWKLQSDGPRYSQPLEQENGASEP